MRDIQFRGKRFDNGNFLYGDLRHWRSGKVGIHSDEIGRTFPVDPYTVGEYSGLNDKVGKKIFEGDILQFGEKRLVVWWNDEAFQWQAKERQAVTSTYDGMSRNVVWDNIDLGWIAAEIPCTGHMTTEVIGNIYDNPELLNNYFNCSTTERSRENDKEEF